MKDRLTTAPLPLERPQGSCGTWNARSAFGTASWPLERALAQLERPQGYFVLFVGRRYYLRPIILWNALRPLEQSLWLYLERPQGVSKKPLLHTRYTRNRGGNVEQSWCFRGERFSFWEEEEKRYKSQTRDETIVSEAISDECECKITTFF